MYMEDLKSIYFCYRCGEINGDIKLTEYNEMLCGACGENSLLGITSAIDILNDLHLKGQLEIEEDVLGDIEI